MQKRYYVIGLVVLAVIAGGFFYFKNTPNDMERFADQGDKANSGHLVDVPIGGTPSDKPYYCPEPKTVTKKDLKWITPDGKWENYTPSSADKIMSFVGAQWVGIKIGKIICLYKTDEAVSFPVALEQTRSQLILEPDGGGWSALIKNRRFCKSASTADCPYYIERPKDVSNVYKEIQYNPTTDD